MINNFELLKPLLQFDNPGDCYFIQLLKRQKDNPDMKRNMVNVDNFFVYSLADYIKIEDRVIENSILHNARAYIRVNRRNTYRLCLEANKRIADLLLSKQYEATKNAYLSVAGEFHSEPNKRWIVDVDVQDHDDNFEDRLEVFKQQINLLPPISDKIIMYVPTKNGFHLITKPFRLDYFKKQHPKIDVHKDNPTILYIP